MDEEQVEQVLAYANANKGAVLERDELQAEVERLRGDVEAAQELAGTYEEENERLREALYGCQQRHVVRGKAEKIKQAEVERLRAIEKTARQHIALMDGLNIALRLEPSVTELRNALAEEK